MFRRALPLVLVAVLVAACSSSDGKRSPASSRPPHPELKAVPSAFTGGDKPAFCSTFVAMESSRILKSESVEDVRAYYHRRGSYLRILRKESSNEIRNSVDNQIFFNTRIAKSGNLGDLSDPAWRANSKIFYGYGRAQCPELTTTTTNGA